MREEVVSKQALLWSHRATFVYSPPQKKIYFNIASIKLCVKAVWADNEKPADISVYEIGCAWKRKTIIEFETNKTKAVNED